MPIRLRNQSSRYSVNAFELIILNLEEYTLLRHRKLKLLKGIQNEIQKTKTRDDVMQWIFPVRIFKWLINYTLFYKKREF